MPIINSDRWSVKKTNRNLHPPPLLPHAKTKMKRFTVLLPKNISNDHDKQSSTTRNCSHVQQISPATWWPVTTYYQQVKSPPLLTAIEGRSLGWKGSRDSPGIITLRVLANSWSYPFNLSLYFLYRSLRSNFCSFSSLLKLTLRIHNP